MNPPAFTDETTSTPTTDVVPPTDGLWHYVMEPVIPIDTAPEEQVERIFRDGRLTDCNDVMARMYGLAKADDLIGVRVSDLLIETDAGNQAFLHAFVTSNYRVEGRESTERAPDGSLRRFVNSVVGIVRDGALVAAWGTQVDVTARMAMEQQARQAETIVALNRLAGGVAHDFNNLLTTILTSVDMLEETLEPGHVAREDAGEIRRAARRGAELTRQLLALSQQQVLVPRPVDLNLVVRRAVNIVRRSVPAALEVRERYSSLPAVATIDGEELEQVLIALAGYAAESMSQRGFMEFEIGTHQFAEPFVGNPDTIAPGMWVAITITDSAPAFPSRDAGHLFEPFFGVALAESASGMALATLRGFARQSGGAVVLHTPPTGRRLSMYFPASANQGTGESSGDRGAPSSGTVLLAEDEPTVRLLMKRVLQRAGYVVIVASNGDEALELSRGYAGHVDVLVTDVIMPGMGGGELSRRLRQERPGLRVLHVSGYTAGALRQNEALEDGAAFLQKPFTPKALVSRVVEVMADGRARRS